MVGCGLQFTECFKLYLLNSGFLDNFSCHVQLKVLFENLDTFSLQIACAQLIKS